jgi:TPR repeat protein
MNMRTSPVAWRVAAISILEPGDLSSTIRADNTAQWVEAAAGCGIAEAQIKLGRMLLDGDGISRDARAAFACFLCASENGDADGHTMLGQCLENGWGTEPDFSAAVDHYRLAATLGHAGAMNFLGRCHETGFGAARDRLLARAWYRRAAKGGYFQGAYNYATLIAADGCIAGALHWFERALSDAPPQERADMVTALSSHTIHAIRQLAARAA